MSSTGKIYRYPSDLEVKFPEGLDEIRFLKQIDGFNYLSVKKDKKSKIKLPSNFEESELPESFLEEKRQEKYARIESKRKELQLQEISYQDRKFSASQTARQNMMGIILLEIISIIQGAKTDSYYWQDINGNAYQFSRNDFKEMMREISLRDSRLYYIEAEAKNSIKNEKNLDSLESFNIESTWDQEDEKYQKLKADKDRKEA